MKGNNADPESESVEVVEVHPVEKDSIRAWLMLVCAIVNLTLVGAVLIGLSPVFFVALLDEFEESKEKTGTARHVSLYS